MFDFEKLIVYQKAREQNIQVLKLLFRSKKIDSYLKDQWRRAAISITLNLAEGSGRTSKAEKKRFYTIARSSVFECVAIMDILKDCELLDLTRYQDLYRGYEELYKMLLAMFRATTD